MSNLIVIIVIGLLGGIAIGLQAPLAAMIAQRLGVLESVFIVHLGGAIIVAVPLLLLGGGKLGMWPTVPWYALCAGVLGIEGTEVEPSSGLSMIGAGSAAVSGPRS